MRHWARLMGWWRGCWVRGVFLENEQVRLEQFCWIAVSCSFAAHDRLNGLALATSPCHLPLKLWTIIGPPLRVCAFLYPGLAP